MTDTVSQEIRNKHRQYTIIALRYDDLGNSISVRDPEETARCYEKARQYREMAKELKASVKPTEYRIIRRYINEVEWRRIEGFPNYEMNSEGVLRTVDSLLAVNNCVKSSGYIYVQMRNGDKRASRSRGKLLRQTFPELVSV